MPKVRYFNEEDVLQKVMMLFWSKGFAATSLSDILKEVDLGKQSLYNAFGDKSTLFRKALDHYKVISEQILSPLFREEAGFAELEEYFYHHHSAFSMIDIDHKACMVGNTVSQALSQEDHDLAVFAKKYLSFIEQAFYTVLEKALQRGEIRQDLDLEVAARYLLNNGYGLGILARAEYTQEELHEVVQFFLSSLKA